MGDMTQMKTRCAPDAGYSFRATGRREPKTGLRYCRMQKPRAESILKQRTEAPMTNTKADVEVDAENAPTLDELTGEEINERLTEVSIEMPDGEESTLAEVAADLVVAHNEIERYKQGALALSQSIDEASIQHEMDGDEEVVEILKELKRTAFGAYLRVKRGDDELMGSREGKYSGYFADDEVKQ